MTISSETNRVSYSGNDVTTAFAVSYQFFADADLRVVLVTDSDGSEVVQTLTTDYTVTGAGSGSGTVTMLTAPATGKTLVIIRDQDYIQELDLINNDSFDAEELEDALDKIVIQALQLKDLVDRAFQLSEGDTSGIDLTLPNTAGNALGLLRINAGLTALEYVQAADIDLATVSSFIDTLLDDSNQTEAQHTLGLTPGVNVQAYDSATLKANIAAQLSAGQSHTVYAINSGTAVSSGTITPDPDNGNVQHVLVDGPVTIAPPTMSDDQACLIDLIIEIDGGSATVTISGDFEANTGTLAVGVDDNDKSLMNIRSIKVGTSTQMDTYSVAQLT